MTMWGSKKDGPEDEERASQADRASSRRSYDHQEPNERTRLLDHPRPPNSDGYLDPDDPAVRTIDDTILLKETNIL
jgi:hypothetical protein